MSQSYSSNVLIPNRDVIHGEGTTRVNRADESESGEMQELIHEIRQPLEVIESLAYYLELVSREQQVSQHLQTIRTMVSRVHGILEARLAS